MRKPVAHKKRAHSSRKSARPRPPQRRPQAPHGFLAAFNELLPPERVPTVPPRRGAKPRVPLAALLTTLVFHVMHAAGTLAEHFALLFEDALSESVCADRRARTPWQVFADLMARALRPLAHRTWHPEAYWQRWRLVALDGTQFSLINTPANQAARPKSRSRRGPSAFADELWNACQRVGSHFLIRARTSIKVQVLRPLADGSRLVRVPVYVPKTRRVSHYRALREIRVRVGRKGFPSQALRLWTSLLDPVLAPADQLAPLYAQRWEHELFYRHLKRELRRGSLLQSHPVTTAAQEIAALMLASALLARERARAAAGLLPVRRVSFVKTLELLRPWWLIFEVGADLLSARVQEELLERCYEHLRQSATRRRRSRSCPRAVRQPVSKWPRLFATQSTEGPVQFTFE
jgi:hypothetical protein